jgi:hypothetical protein
MMEAARTSETLLNFYQTTRRYNPEDSHLRTHRRENLKSYMLYDVLNFPMNAKDIQSFSGTYKYTVRYPGFVSWNYSLNLVVKLCPKLQVRGTL